ncbi:kunitz/BPTI-like toxin isoform X1 [Ahaetulla prasina]|uniref:kunitz/BPTI-like toxin isoform X1 n=1 Tax=Ahaetulla prasina TaxID=499056 RepID=UPI002649B327|nr:kunitz/BPTI-like toxin isoform X1 [Ahaetulla prasina]
MSSGSLLLLLGLLTLWAELTPVSGQKRPKLCYLPPETGPCRARQTRFYYNPASNKCQEFVYGGCQGNANRFETREECHFTCVEKRGVCPQGPQQRPCLEKCQNDWNCPGRQKCCRYGCLAECKDPAYGKHALPTRRPTRIGTTV